MKVITDYIMLTVVLIFAAASVAFMAFFFSEGHYQTMSDHNLYEQTAVSEFKIPTRTIGDCLLTALIADSNSPNKTDLTTNKESPSELLIKHNGGNHRYSLDTTWIANRDSKVISIRTNVFPNVPLSKEAIFKDNNTWEVK